MLAERLCLVLKFFGHLDNYKLQWSLSPVGPAEHFSDLLAVLLGLLSYPTGPRPSNWSQTDLQEQIRQLDLLLRYKVVCVEQ